mgnify:CR=1 FL=1
MLRRGGDAEKGELITCAHRREGKGVSSTEKELGEAGGVCRNGGGGDDGEEKVA